MLLAITFKDVWCAVPCPCDSGTGRCIDQGVSPPGGGGEESLEKRMEVQAVVWTGQVGRVSSHGVFSGLRELLLKQETKSGISAGGGGMRPEYFVAPRERMDISEMEEFVLVQFLYCKLAGGLFI